MVKVFEKTQQVNNIGNYQSRIVEYNSFQDYLENMDLPNQKHEISYKHIDHEKQVVTFIIEINLNSRWVDYVHYAEVIE